ncbi:MAG: hypothetical protein QOG20_6687 [Pseudonocardiales bacterium]|jgi:hypothetical protein|uniref:hypothetical protein n=1 Tax=Pseudonocardia sp. TaxID=60912 RepID=UPI002625B5C6|nr:hypothetical protein [Pseudonocardia sp.]MCW2720665.1 hypothetical protein [Pseudonocardia sp.]MDT7616753.1 hypothetical protein [Pseudonocardiales bacterium]MDT7711080.1 hypothetical protein [Pseudonocardiales bacterium]
MSRKPLTITVVIGAVAAAVLAGATAAYAAPGDQPAPTTGGNRGWDTPPRDAIAQLDRQ